MDERELETITAYHEAGHALMAVNLGARIVHVSIEPPDDDGLKRYGESIVQWPTARASDVDLAEIQVSLAGPVAELVYLDEWSAIAEVPEFAADWQRAMDNTSRLVENSKASHWLHRVEREVRLFFGKENMWAATCAIADLLLAHQTVEHDEIAEMFGFWNRQV